MWLNKTSACLSIFMTKSQTYICVDNTGCKLVTMYNITLVYTHPFTIIQYGIVRKSTLKISYVYGQLQLGRVRCARDQEKQKKKTIKLLMLTNRSTKFMLYTRRRRGFLDFCESSKCVERCCSVVLKVTWPAQSFRVTHTQLSALLLH